MMKEIKIEDLKFNPFTKIGKEWMLINSDDGKTFNSMTANWGTMGFLWGKNVVTIFVRPQRYTKKLIDNKNSKVSLSFFDGAYKKEMALLGSQSAYDYPDKIKTSGLIPIEVDGVKTYKEASLTMELNILYRQTITENCFIDQSIIDKQYPEKDFHDMYVCEIKRIIKS